MEGRRVDHGILFFTKEKYKIFLLPVKKEHLSRSIFHFHNFAKCIPPFSIRAVENFSTLIWSYFAFFNQMNGYRDNVQGSVITFNPCNPPTIPSQSNVSDFWHICYTYTVLGA